MNPQAPNEQRRAVLAALLLVVGVRILVSLAAWALGAPPVSDDDFARLTIAQGFALMPSWDPSGTSWLPAPFWFQGSLLAIFGRDPFVAQCLAVATGGGSAALLFVAASWLGASRRAALAVGLGSSFLPHMVWFGLATIPDGYTAALVVLAVASVEGPPSRRAWGAAALGFATLCRYETWALASLFLLRALFEWRRGAPWRQVVPLALPMLGPFAWMLHGALHHGDATFFLQRVTAYRRALGLGATGALWTLWNTPWTLLRAEPLVTALIALALWFRRSDIATTFRWPLACVGGVVAFLVVGDYGDGAATHHPERAVLGAILTLFVVSVVAMERECTLRSRTWAIAIATVVLGSVAFHPLLRGVGAVDRRAELALGRALRQPLGEGALALVESPDFGYFAVAAGLGVPSRIEPLDSPDPRERDTRSVQPSAIGLAAAAKERRATHVALLRESQFSDPEGGVLLLSTERYRVFRVARAPLAGK